MEITINGITYTFKAGIGFMYDAEKLVVITNDDGRAQKKGLLYLIAEIIDGKIESLIDALLMMNKGQKPRLERKQLEEYIEDESTDIDKLFEDVLSFFEKSNCTKKTVRQLMKMTTPEVEEAEE